MEAITFTLVTGEKFTKTLDLEGVRTEEVQRRIKEFQGGATHWIEVDDGVWIRANAVVVMEPEIRRDEPESGHAVRTATRRASSPSPPRR